MVSGRCTLGTGTKTETLILNTEQAHIIVFGNEKGGTGKSTLAMHVVVSMLDAGKKVAVIDLDSRQQSLSRYIENRKQSAQTLGIDLSTPEKVVIEPASSDTISIRETEEQLFLQNHIDRLSETHQFIVIDCPGNDTYLARQAHAHADTLITPMNDSFVDLDLLGQVNPDDYSVQSLSHYSELVWESRKLHSLNGKPPMDWIVTRNRLATLHSRNNQRMDNALKALQKRVMFRYVPGLSERVVYRELFPQGLTLLDLPMLGKMQLSHVTARHELRQLVNQFQLVAD